jgi:hypothetical protein
MPRPARAFLRLVDLAGEPPEEVLLFKAGTNRTYKGDLLFDDLAARLVLADAEDHGADFFFDYDHFSLYGFSREAGEAAAWFSIEVRDGELWAVNIRWTEDGAAKVRARKYRYISPAVEFQLDNRRIARLINVALTNLPASHGLPPLMAASQGGDMLQGALEHIAKALGLDPATATEEDLIKAFDDHMEADAKEEEEEGDDASLKQALDQLCTLTGKDKPAAALTAALAELEAARSASLDQEIADLVERGIATRRIPAENRDAYVKLGRKDLGSLRELVGATGDDGRKPEGAPPKGTPPKPAPPERRPAPPTVRHTQATLSARTPAAGEFDLAVARVLNIDPTSMTGDG